MDSATTSPISVSEYSLSFFRLSQPSKPFRNYVPGGPRGPYHRHQRGSLMSAEARIKELGLTLPQPPKPLGNYVPGVRVGNLLFLSGHGPLRVDGVPTAR